MNQVTTEGLPVLFVKDLPPASTVSLQVTRPQIYYGELADQLVFVGTGQQEFDYPAGDENVYTTYDGKGGVPRRLAWPAAPLLACALRLVQDPALSATSPTTSRVLYHRNIVDARRRRSRSSRSIRDPYMVVDRRRPAALDPRRLHDDDAATRTPRALPTAPTTCATA